MSITSGYRYAGKAPTSKLVCQKCGEEFYRDAVYDSAVGWYLPDSAFECPECDGEAEEER